MLQSLKNSLVGRLFGWLTNPETPFWKIAATVFVLIFAGFTYAATAISYPVWTLVGTALLTIIFFVTRKKFSKEEKKDDSEGLTESAQQQIQDGRPKPIGRYFNNLEWHWHFRPIVCIGAGVAIGLLVWLLSAVVGLFMGLPVANYPIGPISAIFIALGTAGYYWFTGQEKEKKKDKAGNETTEEAEYLFEVPGTQKAVLIGWLGMPRIPAFLGFKGFEPFYLTSSTYDWLGKELGFAPILSVAKPFTDADGFFFMGDIPFTVWNEATAPEGSKERGFISAPAKNDSTIRATFTLILNIVEPIKLLNASMPAFDLGERARQEFREFTQNFVDTDIPKLHQVLGDVLTGASIVTCFLGKPVDGRKAGSMIRDVSDMVMYEPVTLDKLKEYDTDKDREKARKKAELKAYKKLQLRIIERGNDAMRKSVLIKNDNGTQEFRFTVIRLQNPIGTVIETIGCSLSRTSISDVAYSAPVSEAADNASAEEFQRVSMLASADSAKAYREKLLPSDDEKNDAGFELRTILAAAVDPGNKNRNVRVIWTPGGNSLTSAAVVGASEIEGEK